MPIIIDGYLTVSTDKLRTHAGHDLAVALLAVDHRSDLVSLWCRTCTATIEREPEPRDPSLPCGCLTADEHSEGVRLQDEMRKAYRIPRSTCVGCHVGDDGISVHSCVIHDKRYWA